MEVGTVVSKAVIVILCKFYLQDINQYMIRTEWIGTDACGIRVKTFEYDVLYCTNHVSSS